MQAIKKKWDPNFVLLLAVIITAAILRFWDLSGMAFMHDELSGLFRAQSATIADVIKITKETDVHPFGVPVFIHCWTLLFGNSEIAVKFPFLLFGLLSIFFTYKIAAKWFNDTVAIVVCAFMATLQYTTMYGQLARPYASGIFFSTMMVWFWSEYLFSQKEKKKYDLIAFIISAVLCAYNHYFSLLFVVIVGSTGLFFLNKKNALPYLFSGIIIILLFIPMFPVFTQHLSLGGAMENDWLAKPEKSWIYTFLKYLFHYSKIVYTLVGLILLISFFHIKDHPKLLDQKRIVAFVFGVSSFVIAYLYSIYKNPVLQFSTLSFSIPFLLMFLFSFIKDLSFKWKSALVSLIVIINIYSLVFQRKHYTLFYDQNYEAFAKAGFNTIKKYGNSNTSIALVTPEGFMDYYFQKYNQHFTFYRCKNDLNDFRSYVEQAPGNYFVAGNLPLEYLQIVKEIFPYKIYKEEGFTLNLYCFSKQKTVNECDDGQLFLSENTFSSKVDLWNNESVQLTNEGFKMDSITEYSPNFSAKLKDITKGRHNIINASAEICCTDSLAEPVLVMDIHSTSGLKIWRGGERSTSKAEQKIYISQLLSEIDLEKYPDAELKLYIWNRNKKKVRIKNIKVEIIESNPYIYGLFYAF